MMGWTQPGVGWKSGPEGVQHQGTPFSEEGTAIPHEVGVGRGGIKARAGFANLTYTAVRKLVWHWLSVEESFLNPSSPDSGPEARQIFALLPGLISSGH